MHADLNVSVLEFNRRSVRPHFEFVQLVGGNVLQCTYPLSRNQEAGIAARDDLNGIPLGHVADSLRLDLGLGLNSAGGKRRSVLGITDPYIGRHNFTRAFVPSGNSTRTCSFVGSYSALAICFATRGGLREQLDLSRFAHYGPLVDQTSRSSRQPPAAPTIRQSLSNIAQESVHYPLQRNVLDRRDANQFHRTIEVRKSHSRDPTFAAVSRMDVCRAMIVREDIDPGSGARGNKHASHGIG